MFEGKCSWGKIPTNLLASSLESCVNLSLGHIVELASKVTMRPSFLEPKLLEQDSCLTFCSHKVDAAGSYQLQLCMSAQEAGARDMSLSPYSSYSYDDVPPSSLSDIIRLRSGNVLFNYKYYNNTMQETEVTEDFSCPFCYVRCGSFKGLGCHLNSSHDLFHYEFWISESYQVVNVSLKADAWRTELIAEGVDPRHQTFSYRSRFKKRRRSKTTTEKIRHVHSHIMESGSPEDAQAGSEDNCVQGENGTSVANASIDPAQSLHGSNLSPPTVLQFGKTRKLSERADPRNRQLLQKRQFFHSHRAQPMALEQVFSDRDSEDEVDDDIADFEDRRMLDDFVDVTKDEKLIMHMWNSFVRKQRVLADGHIPWACEAFSQLHGRQLVQNPAQLWGWRFFMIKLWNHNILDARTMNTCNTVLQSFQEESTGLK
ncbi:polycomb group protein EMBRYONIC FLOWER 2-like isoform X2 [Sorghum bicolor]|nr:polycomb group protein EMBRYONIC FLOWER 2-like isoform X2 [Sorghum bicolor]|eukprot:XP_021308701.1 polycomb group protein EMBRYONIC FLOWER 2-like isoform X2 [Sorghum bicolor]